MNKIRVLHFDYKVNESREARRDLAKMFTEHSFVEYDDYMERPHIKIRESETAPFPNHEKDIISILPQKDVFLVHPGFRKQGLIYSYPANFPHIKVALLIPGCYESYAPENGVHLFGYGQLTEVVEWILGREIR